MVIHQKLLPRTKKRDVYLSLKICSLNRLVSYDEYPPGALTVIGMCVSDSRKASVRPLWRVPSSCLHLNPVYSWDCHDIKWHMLPSWLTLRCMFILPLFICLHPGARCCVMAGTDPGGTRNAFPTAVLKGRNRSIFRLTLAWRSWGKRERDPLLAFVSSHPSPHSYVQQHISSSRHRRNVRSLLTYIHTLITDQLAKSVRLNSPINLHQLTSRSQTVLCRIFYKDKCQLNLLKLPPVRNTVFNTLFIILSIILSC